VGSCVGTAVGSLRYGDGTVCVGVLRDRYDITCITHLFYTLLWRQCSKGMIVQFIGNETDNN
jgi:hypothetical protein